MSRSDVIRVLVMLADRAANGRGPAPLVQVPGWRYLREQGLIDVWPGRGATIGRGAVRLIEDYEADEIGVAQSHIMRCLYETSRVSRRYSKPAYLVPLMALGYVETHKTGYSLTTVGVAWCDVQDWGQDGREGRRGLKRRWAHTKSLQKTG